jgi:hypothetical protein
MHRSIDLFDDLAMQIDRIRPCHCSALEFKAPDGQIFERFAGIPIRCRSNLNLGP